MKTVLVALGFSAVLLAHAPALQAEEQQYSECIEEQSHRGIGVLLVGGDDARAFLTFRFGIEFVGPMIFGAVTDSPLSREVRGASLFGFFVEQVNDHAILTTGDEAVAEVIRLVQETPEGEPVHLVLAAQRDRMRAFHNDLGTVFSSDTHRDDEALAAVKHTITLEVVFGEYVVYRPVFCADG